MKIKTIEYTKTFNLGNYSNHKIGLIAEMDASETEIEVFAHLKKVVERTNQFFIDMPNYERAKTIISEPDNFTGRDVKAAAQAIEAFETTYSDYIRCFVPASRTLEQGVIPEYDMP